MKKVRYLAGAAGLVPAALMAAVPAHAAAPAQAARTGALAKAVSLHPVTAATTGCIGTTKVGPLNHSHASITFWYTISPHSVYICIGTVHIVLYGKTISHCPIGGVYAHLNIYSRGVQHAIPLHSNEVCGITWSRYVGVHTYYAGRTGVFANGASRSGHILLGPVGTTVP